MNEPSLSGFSDFFQALWDRPPFAWQRDLAARVLETPDQTWPEAIALPTAAGKTACLDIAVYAIAARMEMKTGGSFNGSPRRIFFVVDRRVIVDEAFERARRIARALREADTGILREVGEQLRKMAGSTIPLKCFQLRGGMYRSDAWSRSPLQPSIVAATVDQVGSRLLFRAYGRSAKAWPIQAGLTGNDALILLDEAHCAQPFMETLHAVRKYRQWADSPLPNPFAVTILSATPPPVDDLFRDTSPEPQTPGHPLGDRQLAPKPAALIRSKASGKTAIVTLAKDLVKAVNSLVAGQPLAAVIFVNYVATAREVHHRLAADHGDRAILLTGRMRPIDKDDTVLHRLKHLGSAGSAERALEAPLFVVATQTLEVGADLDFDVLVTECASLDALRQRFGRLNRMGRPIPASAAILMRADRIESSADDPVYGEAIGKTWHWLTQQAGEDDIIDMGISALANRLPSGEDLAALNAPTDHAPVMLPAHVDCWGQTAPVPLPTPEVALFLHGPKRASADVQVVWRADIDLRTPSTQKASLDVLAICPPAVAESLAVPVWTVRRWMAQRDIPMDALSDVESAQSSIQMNGNDSRRDGPVRRVVRWRGRSEAEVIASARSLLPGDVIVIPASEGGWETLGDLPAPEAASPVLDWGDRASAQTRGKAILRLHPDVIAMWSESETKAPLLELAQTAQAELNEDPDGFIEALKPALHELSVDPEAPDWLRTLAAALEADRRLKRFFIPHPLGAGVILRGSSRIDLRPMADAGESVDWFSDEDDSSASGTFHVPLADHLAGVARLARRFGNGCDLPSHIVDALEAAGRVHDTGKAERRFQALLRGGNIYATGDLLAKSEDIPQSRAAFERARDAVGYPRGGRHELLSVRLAESVPELLPEDQTLRDLVLHLIASHHGHCRPFAPVVEDAQPVETSLEIDGYPMSARSDTGLERIDSGVADRFWRLTRRYGWWGLAWLEAIFRLSDHRQSEAEEPKQEEKR